MSSRVHPLRYMESLEDAEASQSGYTGSARWMIPYADLMTLLLGFFILMFAMMKTAPQPAQTAPPQTEQTVADLQKAKDVAEQKAVYLANQLAVQNKDVTTLLNQAQQAALAHQVKPSQTAMDNLEMKLADALNVQGQQVTVSQDARGLVISFQERIFFKPGEATLSPSAQQTLAQLATALKTVDSPIRVEGHTDNSPIQTSQFPSNWELSTNRATTIVRTLVERYGFFPDHLSAAGYGEYAPLADNSTIEGKQKNRRVDIVILNPSPSASSEATPQSPPFPDGTRRTPEYGTSN